MEHSKFRSNEYTNTSVVSEEQQIELEPDENDYIAGKLNELDEYLTSEHITPQHKVTFAVGYTDNKGSEKVSVRTEEDRGITTSFSLRFAKTESGDSIQYNLSDTPDELHTVTITSGRTHDTTETRVSTSMIINSMLKEHPELDVLHELAIQSQYLSMTDVASALMPAITEQLALEQQTTADYTFTQDLDHITPSDMTRTLQFRRVTSNANEHASTSFSIEVPAMSQDTTEPIADTDVGLRFDMDAYNEIIADNTTDSPVVAFGHSLDPRYTEEDIRQEIDRNVRRSSEDTTKILVAAIAELKSTQFSELSLL